LNALQEERFQSIGTLIMNEFFLSCLFILALGQDPETPANAPSSLAAACGYVPGDLMTEKKAMCVEQIVAEILANQDEGYLEPDLDLSVIFEGLDSSNSCNWHARVEPIWPDDEDGNMIPTPEDGLDVVISFDLLEDRSTTNVRAESVSPEGFEQADAFIDAALQGVRRLRYVCSEPAEGLNTIMSFRMEF
jgi:hypothetical protein